MVNSVMTAVPGPVARVELSAPSCVFNLKKIFYILFYSGVYNCFRLFQYVFVYMIYKQYVRYTHVHC